MSFADDVARGLSSHPKTLPSKYHYDALGSVLFEAICLLPEYYPTLAETEILRRHAADIVAAVGPPLELIELGSGSAVKTRYVIEAALARQKSLRYRPIDISKSALESSARALRQDYPGISVDGVAADYLDGLSAISRDGHARPLVLFLGSNIGNFDFDEAIATLDAIRACLHAGDGLLLGADLKKSRAVLEAAYDDPLGVTAAFNLNLLSRINRDLGGRFDPRRFMHRAWYNEPRSRVEMYLVSRLPQRVAIDALSLSIDFAAEESIFTESSYKYEPQRIAELAAATRFGVALSWTDNLGRFSSNLLVAR
ncbi:MAG: L-histidine N(alpha)-methyltransferase [Candidatus Eremiobacteraeota bacterium]|nr:L-histidine N(alpha)-methyltransferase [Candidatus Eremiobacteraeota bacterium]